MLRTKLFGIALELFDNSVSVATTFVNNSIKCFKVELFANAEVLKAISPALAKEVLRINCTVTKYLELGWFTALSFSNCNVNLVYAVCFDKLNIALCNNLTDFTDDFACKCTYNRT